MKVEIKDIDHLGNGIAKEDKITFIPKSVIGDILDISIVKEHKKFNEGRVDKVITPSQKRIKALCPYYDICGGCNISNLSYNNQLEYKKKKVINIFKRYLNIDINPEIIPSIEEYKYRNKITYHNNKKLGLVSIDNDVVEIDNCLLVSDKINNLYKEILKEDTSLLDKLTIRECNNGLVLDIKGKLNIEQLKDYCISIYQNDKKVYEKESPYIKINDLKFLVSPKSFFQINTNNISNLYNLILEKGNLTKNDKVIDLYCGVGSITLYIANYVKEILGIEIIKDAIIDAKENAKLNNINNAEFKCGDVSSLINDNLDGDIIIVDPPRTGLDKHTKEVLNNSNKEKIIYVSCEPMTLVRDLKELYNYNLESITLVDMFPQTHHVECVIKLHRKK